MAAQEELETTDRQSATDQADQVKEMQAAVGMLALAMTQEMPGL